MIRQHAIAGVLVACVMLGCESGMSGSGPPIKEQAAGYVRTLFESYSRGERDLNTYPELGWEHVEALLAMSNDDRIVGSPPANPLSSQRQERCSAGMLALWFVEGIRKGEPIGYPSLNPMCLSHDVPKGDWERDSEANRAEVAAIYQAWWDSVRSEAPEERRLADPLAGSSFRWY